MKNEGIKVPKARQSTIITQRVYLTFEDETDPTNYLNKLTPKKINSLKKQDEPIIFKQPFRNNTGYVDTNVIREEFEEVIGSKKALSPQPRQSKTHMPNFEKNYFGIYFLFNFDNRNRRITKRPKREFEFEEAKQQKYI